MIIMDHLLIGLIFFGGMIILSRTLDTWIRTGRIARISEKIVIFHEHATGLMINKGILRYPGVRLVSPTRSWIAGEATFIAIFLCSLSMGISPAGIGLSLVAGTFLSIVVLAWSFRVEAKKRINDIRYGLPLASFLLSLILESGMGSSAALREVVRALPPKALFHELDEISRSRLLGMSREEAIDKSTMRVPLDEYRLFMNLIRQGERLGVGFSKGFRELSSRMMENQWHRSETLAQKTAVKLLLPLVLFIFPSVFLIVLSPVILNLFNHSGR